MQNNNLNPKSYLWIKIALGSSLFVNFLIIGVVVGAIIRGPDYGRLSKDDAGLISIIRDMPKELQRSLRDDLREQRDEIRSQHEGHRVMRNELITALSTEPIDIDNIKSILDRHRYFLDDTLEIGHEAIVKQIEIMTPEQRKEFIENLSNRQ